MKTNEEMSTHANAAPNQPPVTSTNAPTVTVCLPTIGRMTYVRDTLKSLSRQSLQNYELLVLYNGSDRHVMQEFEDMAKKHPGGRVLSEPDRLPMFANFNRGLREARGKYVVFFHDDDIYESNFLEELVAALESHPSAAFAGSNYYIIDERGETVGVRSLIGDTELQLGCHFVAQLIRRGRGAIPTPGIMFRRDAFDERGWDETLSMHFGDFVVLMRMAERANVALIKDPLLRLRLHAKNASNVPISVAAPMQFATILSYINEFATRRPDQVKHAALLRKSAMRAILRILTWGWLSAESDEEGRACLGEMCRYSRVRTAVLSTLDRIGMRANRRGWIAALARRAGRRIA